MLARGVFTIIASISFVRGAKNPKNVCARVLTVVGFDTIINYNMLTVRFETDEACEAAYKALGIREAPVGSNFVMYDEATPVALMRTHIRLDGSPTLCIDRLEFADGVEDGDKKFFLHAMFFKFREGTPIMIEAAADERLIPFGFEEKDGKMRLYSGEIDLYYNCGGKTEWK